MRTGGDVLCSNTDTISDNKVTDSKEGSPHNNIHKRQIEDAHFSRGNKANYLNGRNPLISASLTQTGKKFCDSVIVNMFNKHKSKCGPCWLSLCRIVKSCSAKPDKNPTPVHFNFEVCHGGAMRSQKSPACEADWANLFSFHKQWTGSNHPAGS